MPRVREPDGTLARRVRDAHARGRGVRRWRRAHPRLARRADARRFHLVPGSAFGRAPPDPSPREENALAIARRARPLGRDAAWGNALTSWVRSRSTARGGRANPHELVHIAIRQLRCGADGACRDLARSLHSYPYEAPYPPRSRCPLECRAPTRRSPRAPHRPGSCLPIAGRGASRPHPLSRLPAPPPAPPRDPPPPRVLARPARAAPLRTRPLSPVSLLAPAGSHACMGVAAE